MPLRRALEHLGLAEVPSPEQFDGAWLRAWQRRNGLSTDAAAAALALSVSSYHRQRTGRSPPTPQTIALACYFELHDYNWLAIAKLAAALARRTSTTTRCLAAPASQPAKLAELPDSLATASGS